MSRRRNTVRTAVRALAAAVLITMLGGAEALLRHSVVLVAVLVLLPVAAYALGRRHGLRALRARSRFLPERLAEELAWYRRSLAELEAAAGRPLSAIIASYRRVQQRYSDGDQP